MMSFIENMGVENMCESIRLDTFSMNEKNNNFYSRLGYEKLGQIYLEIKVICLLIVMKSP